MEIVKTDNAPKDIGPFLQGILSQALLFTPEKLPIYRRTGEMSNSVQKESNFIM